MSEVVVRPVEPTDTALILALIKELADYEKLAHMVVATVDNVHELLFGPKPVAEALVAFSDDEPAGFAWFFHNCSTFLGRPGVYLEDVYVRPHLRGNGVGKALLSAVARIAVDRDCGRFEWSVLNWNTPAIEFYESLGAKPLDEWTMFRMTGEALEKLAEQAQ